MSLITPSPVACAVPPELNKGDVDISRKKTPVQVELKGKNFSALFDSGASLATMTHRTMQ